MQRLGACVLATLGSNTLSLASIFIKGGLEEPQLFLFNISLILVEIRVRVLPKILEHGGLNETN